MVPGFCLWEEVSVEILYRHQLLVVFNGLVQLFWLATKQQGQTCLLTNNLTGANIILTGCVVSCWFNKKLVPLGYYFLLLLWEFGETLVVVIKGWLTVGI